MRTYIDRGGTFTDVVVHHDDGRVEVRKVRSDVAVIGDLAAGKLTFGTTVATNALLERRGVPTALIVSEGFADLVRIGDMTRPDLFRPESRWPPPLCSTIIEVRGRIDADGNEIEPLVLGDLDLGGCVAVAVVLLNSGSNPDHERAVATALAGRDVYIALGHEVDPEVGYLARIETTLVDAAITPILSAALDRDNIGADALAMRSDGGLTPAADLRAPDAVLSGPAGGVVAVAAIAQMAGFDRAVGLDMGGTSTDVCRVDHGRMPRRDGVSRVAGVRIRRPMLEVETIAAGGGSILWNDGLQLGVGPASAGADPGPQCYGRGGPPTLTDAALAVGLVDGDAFDPPLDPGAVDLPGDAGQFLDVAREAMAAAVRRVATARGVDLRDHALVAYGGAAGQHAADVARRLGISTVLVHPCAAVLCAWGHALARPHRTAVRALWLGLDRWADVRAGWLDLGSGLGQGDTEYIAELRHVGTDNAIGVVLPLEAGADDALRAFHREHRARFGFDRRGAVEVVNIRVRVQDPGGPTPVVATDGFDIGDDEVVGPHLLTAPTTSVWVPAGWRARRDGVLLRLDDVDSLPPPAPAHRTPFGAALWGHRLMSVAEQAGAVLERLARSVNIRERRDFSCAIFDGEGRLVANAPHIPVHLGAMGETVRDLIPHLPPSFDGNAWVTNDPAAGGSHLPDLTVVTPILLDGHRFFAASRGHHADVGGTTRGSMPPQSQSLAEEGFVLRRVPLLRDGEIRPDLRDLLVGCREPDTVIADLEAQIAANHHAALALAELGPPDLVSTWMGHLQDVAAEAVASLLAGLADGEATDRVAGIPVHVRLRVHDGSLTVDLTGTGGPHIGNLNAPKAVVRAAVLYSLRVLVDRDIPLNEGSLRHVRIVAPPGSLVDPPAGAAVAGGNVETSQRLVDLFLAAVGAMASSAGTMNNLTIGGAGWSFYETIGGGQGASPQGPGASARQIHMTNTRATDPEVLERRLPLRVRRFGIRRGTGGAGRHRGGNGIVREIEVTAPATAALLATRRMIGAPGLDGGGQGAVGGQHVRRGGASPEAWDGAEIELAAGDVVVVLTPGGGGWGRTY